MQSRNKIVLRVFTGQNQPSLLIITPHNYQNQFKAFLYNNQLTRDQASKLKQQIENQIDFMFEQTRRQQFQLYEQKQLTEQRENKTNWKQQVHLFPCSPESPKFKSLVSTTNQNLLKCEQDNHSAASFRERTESQIEKYEIEDESPRKPPTITEVDTQMKEYIMSENNPKLNQTKNKNKNKKPIFLENYSPSSSPNHHDGKTQKRGIQNQRNRKQSHKLEESQNQSTGRSQEKSTIIRGNPEIFKRLFQAKTHSFQRKGEPQMYSREEFEYQQMMAYQSEKKTSVSHFQDLSAKSTACFRMKTSPIKRDQSIEIIEPKKRKSRSPSYINKDMIKGSHCEAREIERKMKEQEKRKKENEKEIRKRIKHKIYNQSSSVSPATSRKFKSRQCQCCDKPVSPQNQKSQKKPRSPIARNEVLRNSRPYVSGLLKECYQEFNQQLRNAL